MKNPKLLLIEDNDLDARLLESAIGKAAPQIEVHRATDGLSGLEAIQATKPGMVLLDLSMPGLHGFEVLENIRSNSGTSNTPVVVCSNSDAESDIVTSYKKRANAYVMKPDSQAGYAHLAETLTGFWYNEAKLPG